MKRWGAPSKRHQGEPERRETAQRLCTGLEDQRNGIAYQGPREQPVGIERADQESLQLLVLLPAPPVNQPVAEGGTEEGRREGGAELGQRPRGFELLERGGGRRIL